jgi:hypothetical protein
MKILASVLGVVLLVFSTRFALAADPVIVHEWGTFTCLQDEKGQAIGGINVDDEPVPSFVWQYANRMVASQYSQADHNFGLPPYNADGGKGWTVGDPTVTMRLETPVIYLYPPKGKAPQSVPPLDVHVDFHGGVLSQYYPYAQTNGAQLNGTIPYLNDPGISNDMETGLTWKSVRLGSSERPVDSNINVWTTPREVSAPLLEVKFYGQSTQGWRDIVQAEHFLFYRGVGHLDSPVLLMRNDKDQIGDEYVELRQIIGDRYMPTASQQNIQTWLLDIKNNGACAFRSALTGVTIADVGVGAMGKISGNFSSKDFTVDNLTKLKSSMHDALVKEGLYSDEATAMLKTWELSYFKSPGLRFFYIVPRAWTEKVLPLTVTGAPTEITRVMVGRIELITDAQKAALARLAEDPSPDLAAVKKAALDVLQSGKIPKNEVDAFYRGEKPLNDLGITIPPLVQDYLNLGRFRDALVVHEHEQHSTPALSKFILENRLMH